jgi:hypothetical protein
MPATTTREASHARVLELCKLALERVLPLDRTKNMRGRHFADWEQLVLEHFQPVLAAVLEERAKNDPCAHIPPDRLGRCPHCLSEKIYLHPEETSDEVLSTHGAVVLQAQHCRCRACDRSFSAQAKEWQLPSEAPLSPHALRRVAREATVQSFDKAAAAINEDWNLTLDGKQIQRWVAGVGKRCVKERDLSQMAYEAGAEVVHHANPPKLLVVEVDGGRVQTCEINPESGSRWREDKVAVVCSYLPGDARHEPQALVTTHVATMQKAEPFGKMVKIEAERRGYHTAGETILMGDGGNWIDPLFEREFENCPRIVDWYHAAEHLHACAKAVHGAEAPAAAAFAEQLKTLLNAGKIDAIVTALERERVQLNAARAGERAVLETNQGYFSRHKEHMNYPEYRRKGWPIGSGGVEGAVKQFNKRVKGSEQFWQEEGVEGILALRAMWLSGDERWSRYWGNRPAYLKDCA